jgi:hypothetical protein
MIAATDHMPFKGHRTVAEVDADKVSKKIRRSLGGYGSEMERAA